MRLHLIIIGIFSTILAYSYQVSMSGQVGTGGSVHDGQAIGTHDPSKSQGSWKTVLSFQVDSAYINGFTISTNLNGTGWSLFGTGTTQDNDFNAFTAFRLRSTDSANYVGTNTMNSILPTWGTIDTNTLTFSNGAQTEAMTNWTVEAQAKWSASASLTPGGYTQTLDITIEEGS